MSLPTPSVFKTRAARYWIMVVLAYFTIFAGSSSAATLELKYGANRLASVQLGTLQILPSVGCYFVFQLNSGSTRTVLRGPLRGDFQESVDTTEPSHFRAAGTRSSSGTAYAIEVRRTSARSIELNLTFSTTNPSAKLQFEICRLNSYLFKGGKLSSLPVKKSDPSILPVVASKWSQRHILSRKRAVTVKSPFAELIIHSLERQGRISIADFRASPSGSQKVFSVYHTIHRMVPYRQYHFRYLIRAENAVQSDVRHKEILSVPFSETEKTDYLERVREFFKISPARFRLTPGKFSVTSDTAIFGNPGSAAETILAREIARMFEPVAVKPLIERSKHTIRDIWFSKLDHISSSKEEFLINITPKHVKIQAGTERAKLYATWALVSRLKVSSGACELPCGSFEDNPDLAIRGMLLESSRSRIGDVKYFKRYLEALSRARTNLVIFYHEPLQIRSWMAPEKTKKHWWTRRQMIEIASYARYLGMKVWAGVKSKFDSKHFPELIMAPESNIYDPRIEDNYTPVFSLYDEVISAYRPSVFLIGHDEVKNFERYDSGQFERTAQLFAEDIRRIHAWLAARKVETAMWGDMLLDHRRWANRVGHANSINPRYCSGATHKSIDLLPKDIWIIDWHYDVNPIYPSIGYFHEKGFKVLGCIWNKPKASQNMAKSIRIFDGDGVVGSDWGLWAVSSPSATTLYSPLCGWRTDCNIISDWDRVALASLMRGDLKIQWAGQIPLSLEAAFNVTTWDSVAGDGIGFLDAGLGLDLRALQTGKQELAGILFKIYPSQFGKSLNCIMVASGTAGIRGLPILRTIPVYGTKASAIAFLHAGYLEKPSFKPLLLGRYIIEYDNGDSVKVDLKQGWNISDLRSDESLRNEWSFGHRADIILGARRAWKGKTAAGIPIHLQAYIWKNPFPTQSINNITLESARMDQRTRIMLLAVTFLQ